MQRSSVEVLGSQYRLSWGLPVSGTADEDTTAAGTEGGREEILGEAASVLEVKGYRFGLIPIVNQKWGRQKGGHLGSFPVRYNNPPWTEQAAGRDSM
jgi:hypothetical protein